MFECEYEDFVVVDFVCVDGCFDGVDYVFDEVVVVGVVGVVMEVCVLVVDDVLVIGIWVVSLSTLKLIPQGLSPKIHITVFGVWLRRIPG